MRFRYRKIYCLLCGITAAMMFAGGAFAKAEYDVIDAEIPAEAYLLMEKSSGQIIMEKNSDLKYPAAGLSRLPALLVICEAFDCGNLNGGDVVTVSSSAAAVPGPTAFLETGELIAAEALLKSAVMISAGDSIMALAQELHGSEQAFLSVMNERLQTLGIDAEYESLVSAQPQLTAKELATIGGALAESNSFMQYSSLYMDELIHKNGRKTELVNPNKMVKNYSGCYGVATGSSKEAGYCGIFAVTRMEKDMICVVSGAKTSKARFEAAQILLEYGVSNFRSVRLAAAGEIKAAGLPVHNGTISSIDLIAKRDISIMIPKDSALPLESPDIPARLEAPFTAGETLGKIDYMDENGRIYATLELTAATGADVAGFGEHLRNIFLFWLHG